MTVHGGRGAASASLVIRKQRTGEVLLEVTVPSYSPSSSSSRVPSTAEGKESSLFSDAFTFIAEAQAKTYDFFGRNMVKESGTISTADTTVTRARRENYVDAMMSCDAPSSSFLDSAEWEGDGTNDKSVSSGEGNADEENGDYGSEFYSSTTPHSHEVDPPAKRPRK
ncbi:uncharacterized protein TM35_000631130 [Trypanosoma theileri]|uniref:Uncharacterized protein n=1 Tax=Trypanosoma theileri TaxID=67003 RepID=A0A1X0NGN6_9TRYP|nr:uncharacterized protein TM35_000631130 [Trypanosoma theileri]ORC83613.1 hypothetical protein TM35_000631130 [Trypanosoma theileri]